MLRDADFTPERVSTALFVPPTGSRMLLRSATAIERIGERWFTSSAGVSVVEASKQIYAKPAAKRKENRHPAYLPVATGARRTSLRGHFSEAGCQPRAPRSRNSACSAMRLASVLCGFSR